MKKVSIIMAVYNTQEFLTQSIQSVIDQTYNDLELIIINDNSDDDSDTIINEFVHLNKQIKAYHNNKRLGVGATRNIGIEKATGEYVYFLDSDDFLPEDTIQLLIENIRQHDLISGRLIRADKGDTAREVMEENETTVEIYTENKYNLIRNNSVLNRLFRMDYIKENNLRFIEEIDRYTDLSFIVPALLNVEKAPYIKTCLYFKRRRNDPLSNPALLQTGMEDRINDFTSVYNILKDKYLEAEVQLYLDEQFIRLYKKPIIKYFKMNENVDDVFDVLVTASRRVNLKLLRGQKHIVKKEIKALREGDMEKFKKINLRHYRLRQIKTALKGRRRLYIQLYRSVFLRMPIKEDTIIFESFLGKSYSDSPKYIYEHMVKNNMNFKYIWIFKEKKKNLLGNPIQIKRFSLKYFYYMARAKYWVNNSRIPKTLNKRKDNIYLQTWHGTPLKTLVFDMKDVYSADPAYKRNFYNQSRRWDYLSSPNAYSSNIFRRAFKYDKEMLEYGYPRNDILYQKNTEESISALKKKMNLPADKKVVLYAPTWRDDEFYAKGQYKFTLQLDLKELQKQLGNEYIVILRMHYFIASQLDITEFKGFAYDFSSYDDIAELYLVSDVLITDYSSVFFDYAHLKRPILFFTYDLEKYRDKLRGFYIDIETEVPGPLLRESNEVINALKDIEEVEREYRQVYDEFYEKYCKWDDGNASKKTVQAVFERK